MAGAMAQRIVRQDSATTVQGISDEDLLAQFLDAETLSSQEAFRILVGRHGPRVLGICRHVLNREHDAEDAFQATFLALARNGASIRDRCALAGWLHEVAYRTALKTRARRSRRQTVERKVMETTPPREQRDVQGDCASLSELRPMLQEEVTSLPDKYRIPVILSYLEGKTNEEVAAILNWPVGTVKGRLSRGRALLRSRLTRRGVALSTAALLALLTRSEASAAALPEVLLRRTLRRAIKAGAAKIGASADASAVTAHPAPASSGASNPPTSSSPGGPITGNAARDPAAISPDDPASVTSRVWPASSSGSSVRPWSFGRLASAALVVVTLIAAVFVGGCVSSAAYGGRLPNLRSAFSGFMPTLKTNNVPSPCHAEPVRPDAGTAR